MPKYYKWNMTMGLIHGISFAVAMAFSAPFSVLPVFLKTFGISTIMIGLIMSVIKAASAIPQLLVARKMKQLHSGKVILFCAIWARWLAWGLIAASVFVLGDGSQTLILIIFIILLFLFSFAGGVANVPFFDMVAKAIPANKRGRFFGLRQFCGGLGAVGAGFLVRWILELSSVDFPYNYGYLFLITFGVLTFGYVALSLFKELPGEQETIKQENKSKTINTWAYLRQCASLRNVVISQLTSQSLFISMPFFVLYARQELHFAVGWIGYFVTAQMAGGVLSNLLWARLSDKFGNRIVILLSIFAAFGALVFALAGHSLIVFMLVFVLAGFFVHGSNIGYKNYIMEIGDEKERPQLISIQGTLMFPIYFFPLSGGFFINQFGFVFTFTLTAVLLLISLIFSFKLSEPRNSISSGCNKQQKIE